LPLALAASAAVAARTGVSAAARFDAAVVSFDAPAIATCGCRQTYTSPSAKIATNPATTYHFTLSRRAGREVTLATGAAPPGSTREFTPGFCVSSPAPPPAPPPAVALSCAGGGAVPEIATEIGVPAATVCRTYAFRP